MSGLTRYQQQQKSGGDNRNKGLKRVQGQLERTSGFSSKQQSSRNEDKESDSIDSSLGFDRIKQVSVFTCLSHYFLYFESKKSL